MYKNSADLLPTAISSLFVKNDVYHDHYTRVSSLLHVPVYTVYRFSAITIWTYVETNVPIFISFTSFKNAIKYYLLGNNVKHLYKSVKFSYR